MKTLIVRTLGCSKNTVDSEHIAAAASSCYVVLPDSQERLQRSDVFLLNTCSFIADAKQESIDAIMEAIDLKRQGVYGKVVVFGCLAQRYSSQMPSLIPEVDAWFGARDFSPLLEYLGVEKTLDEKDRLLSTPSHYAYLKISEGCDRRCSYCAIPFIRGRHRSTPVEDLVEEARCLAAKGVKELIVIAQDTTYYGLDLYGKRDLARLLHALSEVEGIQWIRLHYSYPEDFPQDVLDEMASNPKICKYIDIPLQHVSDAVLSNMHRGVDGQRTRELVRAMREKVPGVVLRTTMIVGHPGEDVKAFRELMDFVRETRFDRLGAFTFSREEGTFAATHLRDSVARKTKEGRLERLMNLQKDISREINESYVGRLERVIVDSLENGVLICRTSCQSPDVDGEVFVKPLPTLQNPAALVGSFIDVRIVDVDDYDLYAQMI